MRSVNKAFIFAAGLGTRLRPLTDTTPKPLIKVAGKTLLDYSIDLVIDSGIKKIAVNTHYLSDQIDGHLQRYLESGVDIQTFHESERLETGGGLMNAIDFINYEPVITINSDVILKYQTNPIQRLMKNWDPEKYDLFMLLSEKEKAIGYYEEGNFNVDNNGFLIIDNDKPYIYTGIQIINTVVLREYAGRRIFSLSDVFKDLSSKNRIGGMIHDNYWLHVGDLKGLEAAELYLKQ